MSAYDLSDAHRFPDGNDREDPDSQRARAKLLLEGMSQLQYERGRLSKITVEDAERLLAHLDGWLPAVCKVCGHVHPFLTNGEDR